MICQELTINGQAYEIPDERYLLGLIRCEFDYKICRDCPAYDQHCMRVPARVSRYKEAVGD